MSLPTVRVPVKLDRDRTIVMSFNALCDAEEKLGVSLITTSDIDLTSLRSLRALLWAGLKHEDPTLTLEKVGDIITATEGGMITALNAVSLAIQAALPAEVGGGSGGGQEGNAEGSR
jgi:hypothetical protein